MTPTPTITMTACAVLLFIAVAYLYLENRSLRRKGGDLKNEYDRLHFKHTNYSLDASFIPTRTVWVNESLRDYSYQVYVKSGDNFFTLRRYTYDPADPEDREYKRAHAQEVADLLNEKP